MVLERYFKENNYLAASIAATGTSLGFIFFPVAIYHLEEVCVHNGHSSVDIIYNDAERI